MEPATCSFRNSLASSSPLPISRPFSGKLVCLRKGFGVSKTVTVKATAYKRSDSYNHNFDGKLVDEGMIVLRKRIHEMNMLEKDYEPPQHWMEWEKEYKKEKYDVDVCKAMGSLQSKLMETRPGVALGMGVLLLCLPTSMAAVLFHVMANWP